MGSHFGIPKFTVGVIPATVKDFSQILSPWPGGPFVTALRGVPASRRTERPLRDIRNRHTLYTLYTNTVGTVGVAVICSGAGPTALLVAGTHGDEYEGQLILR